MTLIGTEGILTDVLRGKKEQKKYNKNIKKYINITDTRRIRNIDGDKEQLRVYIDGELHTLDYEHKKGENNLRVQEEYRTNELLLLNGIQNKEIMRFISKTTQDNSDEVRTDTITLGDMIYLMEKEELWEDNNLNKLEKILYYSRFVFSFVYLEQAVSNGIIKILVNNNYKVSVNNYVKVYNNYIRLMDLTTLEGTTWEIKEVKDSKRILEYINLMYKESNQFDKE